MEQSLFKLPAYDESAELDFNPECNEVYHVELWGGKIELEIFYSLTVSILEAPANNLTLAVEDF